MRAHGDLHNRSTYFSNKYPLVNHSYFDYLYFVGISPVLPEYKVVQNSKCKMSINYCVLATDDITYAGSKYKHCFYFTVF